MTSLDRYLDRTYDPERFTCLHFAREVFRDLTGEDIEQRLRELFVAAPEAAARLGPQHFAAFTPLAAPESPCLVYFAARGKGLPHVGVYSRGRVIHLLERGVRCQLLADLLRLYPTVRFLRCA